MNLKEVKFYLDILEKLETNPELVFTSLFGTTGNTIDEADLLNLYYRVNDFNGLSLNQYIKKALCKVLSNQDVLADISVSNPTHINIWSWNIIESKKKCIAQIDLYHKTYTIISYRDSYQQFINESVKKYEPKMDKGLIELKNHLNMTWIDRLHLMKKDVKRIWPSFKVFSYIWFYLFMNETDKKTIRNTYNERMEHYTNSVKRAEREYDEEIKKQEMYRDLLPEYEKREMKAESYIREKMEQLRYVEKKK
ncbi:hypothetical protein [Hungatella hathewayi]|uniref:hypothetical protein n=1 Tax=Hungatella hathewayi TaxID=154046 RepID=UPI00356329B0